jgi:hypothetical protein
MNGSDLFYREVLQLAESERRQERMERADRVCDRTPFLDEPPRPDIDDKNARLLRQFSFSLEGFIESWQQQKGKCLELDKLVGVLAQGVAPVIAAARVRAKECEEKSQICTHHQGAT